MDPYIIRDHDYEFMKETHELMNDDIWMLCMSYENDVLWTKDAFEININELWKVFSHCMKSWLWKVFSRMYETIFKGATLIRLYDLDWYYDYCPS